MIKIAHSRSKASENRLDVPIYGLRGCKTVYVKVIFVLGTRTKRKIRDAVMQMIQHPGLQPWRFPFLIFLKAALVYALKHFHSLGENDVAWLTSLKRRFLTKNRMCFLKLCLKSSNCALLSNAVLELSRNFDEGRGDILLNTARVDPPCINLVQPDTRKEKEPDQDHDRSTTDDVIVVGVDVMFIR